jgi:long-chain acyl-CoA synthetase
MFGMLVAGTKKLLQPEFRPDDVFLAFLPLAHILELLVEMTFYFTGVPVAYGTVKTLTQESVRNCDGDMVAYKPSIIVGVPAVYELIRKGIVKKIHESPAVVQSVFNLAYHLKKTVPMTGAVLDKVVFAKVNNILSQSVESVSSSCGC